MNRDDLLRLHENLCGEALEFMKTKNADYAHGSDPFANFRMFGDDAALSGIVFRMGDKLRRLFKAAGGHRFCVPETSVDTARDLINYCVLFIALEEELKCHDTTTRSVSRPCTRTSTTTAPPTFEAGKP